MEAPKFKIGDTVKAKSGKIFRIVGISQFEGQETSYCESYYTQSVLESDLELVKPKKTITLYRHTLRLHDGTHQQTGWHEKPSDLSIAGSVYTEEKTLEIEE